MEIDPVCNMEVDPKTATQKSTYQGKTYYFCSPGCKRDFDKEPEKYINDDRNDPEAWRQHMHRA
ncbi:MAG TPA: YHS domain-containing protein [Anaerolineales bacterium]|nr:YHS domain-containing protein [Anaerolineales bacterium]